jgi:WD40 repeat protein/serine/threonine protein kinase
MPDEKISEESLFQAALSQATEEEQNAYLEGACAGEPALHDRIENLLRLHHEESGLLDDPPPGFEATMEMPSSEHPGMVIDHYKLMEQIGEGGMGLVFVAEQERPIVRKVALKIIKPGMDTKEVIARFEAERQALAMMDHPNIAKVFDAGTTQSGGPYFVMELVSGISITEYCDRKRLNTRERLELFVATCQAIHHAHQKGVIHRDVKPSNVLVTELDGTPLPKVIDFGVAKATNQRLTERTIYTRHQTMIGTPLYMSPEQAELSALDVDTRTDIYSLGVLLYELLTGVTPIDRKRFQSATFDEIRRIIREEEPPKPSTRISTLGESAGAITEGRRSDPKKMRSAFQGELDWIVMKALEKDRSRRYETALDFSLDVQRFLNEEAVLACPPSTVYRVRKFIRRHRASVMVGLALTFLLFAGIAGTITGWVAETKKASQLTRQIYLMHLTNADDALLQNDYLRARTELDACPAIERGWEWQSLYAQIDAAIPLRIPGAERPWFTRDGKRLIAIGELGTKEQKFTRTWNLSSGQLDRHADLVHESNLAIIAVSSDEKFVVGGGIDGSLVAWELGTGKKLWDPVQTHGDRFDGLAISPDGSLIATTSWDKTLKVFDAKTGDERFELPKFEYRLRKLSFSPDGRWIAAGPFWQDEGAALIVDVAQQKVAQRFPDENLLIPTFAPDGRQIATGTRDGNIVLWDWDGAELKQTESWDISPTESDRLYSLEYSDDGTRLVSGSNSVQVWDVTNTPTELAALKVGGRVYWLSLHPQDDKVAFFTADGIRLWCYGERSEEPRLPNPLEGRIFDARFSADNRQVAVIASEFQASAASELSTQKGAVAILSDSGRTLHVLNETYAGFAWTPDSQQLALGASPDNTVQLVDARTGDAKQAFSGHTTPALPFVDSSGESMISVGWDGVIRVWDMHSSKLIRTFPTITTQDRKLDLIAIGPWGNFVALAFKFEGAVEIWDVNREERIQKLPLHGLFAWRIEFSDDGKLVFVGGTDGKLTMFDVESAQELDHFDGHRGEVMSTAISPNQKQIVSGDSTGRIIIWDVKSTSRLVTLTGAGEAVTSLDWSSDRLSIVAGRDDGTVQIWRLPKSPQRSQK